MVIRIVTFALLFLINTQGAFSQPYVLVKPKSNSESITAFTTVDSNCESAIKKLELIKDSVFFILDEIKCRNEFFFILLINDKVYFSRDIQFSNLELARKKIHELRDNFPNYGERLSEALKQTSIFKDSVRRIVVRNKAIQDSLNIVKADSTRLEEIKKLDSISRALRITADKMGPRRTIILSWSFYNQSEYSDDVYDASINVFNPFRKKIKYIDFTFFGYNPVDDPAVDIRYKTHIRTVKGIGPIEPLESATFTFERMFYSSALHSMKLKSVKVIFFDGTTSIISEPIPLKDAE
jgi:hypothetical protein